MANIRNLRDLSSQEEVGARGLRPGRPAANQSIPTAQMIQRCEQHRVPFYSGQRPIKNPRTENYCDFLTNSFCPVLKPLSFTVIIIVIDIAVFIAQVAIGLDRQGALLQVNAATLDMFKANNPIMVYRGEVYRIITAIFLHVHFLHLAVNILTTFILVSRVEQTYKAPLTILIYLLSGIAGNIFSDAVAKNPFMLAAGASTSLYGMVGVLLGYIIINWEGLSFMPPILRCRLLTTIAIMLIFSIFFVDGKSQQGVDYFGHLGGFLGGLFLSGLPPSIQTNLRQKVIRGVFVSLYCLMILICFLVVYLGRPEFKVFA